MQGTVETVVRISGSGNSEGDNSAASSANTAAGASKADADSSDSTNSVTAAQLPEIELGVDRIIDSQDNEFVLSAPKDNVATLTLDPLLIQDLTFLFASAAVSTALVKLQLETHAPILAAVYHVARGCHLALVSLPCISVVPQHLTIASAHCTPADTPQGSNIPSAYSVCHLRKQQWSTHLPSVAVLQVLGVVFESIKQPVINGYLVAGAIVGPGGLQLIKELVQVSRCSSSRCVEALLSCLSNVLHTAIVQA